MAIKFKKPLCNKVDKIATKAPKLQPLKSKKKTKSEKIQEVKKIINGCK